MWRKSLVKIGIIMILAGSLSACQASVLSGSSPAGSGSGASAWGSSVADHSTLENSNGERASGPSESGYSSEPAILGAREYRLGMSLDELPPPEEVLRSLKGFDWLVYGTKTYDNFYALGLKDGQVVAMASSGLGFEYKGVRAGKPLYAGAELLTKFHVDYHDGYKVHAFFLSSVRQDPKKRAALHDKALLDEARLNFHFTNAFRVYHGLPILKWSYKAAKAARLHSEDMASSDYFDHKDLRGTYSLERMQEQGIVAWTFGENIAGGYSDGFESYSAWIRSAEHRVNVVGDYTRLGVGLAFNEKSRYVYYQTQNFYSTLMPEEEE